MSDDIQDIRNVAAARGIPSRFYAMDPKEQAALYTLDDHLNGIEKDSDSFFDLADIGYVPRENVCSTGRTVRPSEAHSLNGRTAVGQNIELPSRRARVRHDSSPSSAQSSLRLPLLENEQNGV